MTDALWTMLALLGIAWFGRWARDNSAHRVELWTVDAVARLFLFFLAMALSWILVRIVLDSLFLDLA